MATYSGSDKRLQYLFQHGGGGSLEDLDDVEITNPSDGDALVYDGEEEKWVNGEGGGGNANEQVLTKAEYDALTEEQKMNNTTYYINDADTWTSKEVQPVIYSTEEREIGVWTDGKPLYQKTIESNTAITSTGWVILWEDVNIDTIVGYECYFFQGQWLTQTDYYYTGGEQVRVMADTSGNLATSGNKCVALQKGNSQTITATRITVRYTKTTDQPGSGIYTPQGQLAVHYSTEEHVIGTWIDGKPIYEKTIDCGLIPNDTSWHPIAHNISDLKNAVYMTGIIIKTDGTEEIPVNSYRPENTKGFVITRNGANIQFLNNWNVANVYRLYVTIQYTKTTD